MHFTPQNCFETEFTQILPNKQKQILNSEQKAKFYQIANAGPPLYPLIHIYGVIFAVETYSFIRFLLLSNIKMLQPIFQSGVFQPHKKNNPTWESGSPGVDTKI